MVKSKRVKKIQTKEEVINDLKNEFKTNEEIHEKNKEQHKVQVQIGLIKMGLPPARMYDSVLGELQFSVKELKLKIDSKFEILTPFFGYESTPDWRAL